jgi:hypothetical protein
VSTEGGPEVPWVADPSIAWRVLLVAHTTATLDPEVVAQRQRALHAAQGWPSPSPVSTGPVDQLRGELAVVRDEPLVVGVDGRDLVIAAFHAYVDGLGLLDVLAALTDAPADSATRGVTDRPPAESVLRAGLSRLVEVAVAPPARVATTPDTTVGSSDGDAFSLLTVPGTVRTATLVHAASRAIAEHNTEAGARPRRVAVAVGAGRRGAPGEPLANRSELIRLRNVESLDRAEVEAALRRIPLSGAGGTGAAGGRVVRAALRVLGPRLGSTLLLSHLGEVTSEAVSDLAFYPVTAGGSGLSLGAVGHESRTVLTLRARASAWDGPQLEGLLNRIGATLLRELDQL